MIANGQDGVILFHCINGKDRTGVLSALLLRLARVSKQDISIDYAKRSSKLMKYTESMKELITERGEEFSYSLSEHIENVIDYIGSTYGGATEYLLACGISEENINKIKSRFLN